MEGASYLWYFAADHSGRVTGHAALPLSACVCDHRCTPGLAVSVLWGHGCSFLIGIK